MLITGGTAGNPSLWIGSVELNNNNSSPPGLSIASSVETGTLQASAINVKEGNISIEDARGVFFLDQDNSHYVGLKGANTVSANVVWTLPNADGTSGQVLSTDGAGQLAWTTGGGGGGGTPGGANTQLQFNNAGAFGGAGNVTFNNTDGNLQLGNIRFTTSQTSGNIAQNRITSVNPYLGNAANSTNSRIVVGDGLSNAISNADLTVAGSRMVLLDRIDKTDTNTRSTESSTVLAVNLPGNVSQAQTRVQATNNHLIVGGPGNVTQNNIQTLQVSNDLLTIGNSSVYGTSNITVTGATVSSVIGEVIPGSSITNMLLYRPSFFGGGTMTNVFGVSPSTFGATAGVANFSLLHMQNQSGNAWGVNTLPTTSYRFLDNRDTRSSSRVGPIESYFDRPFTFTTTSGSATLDFNNGTSQFVKPTGDMTLSFANALTSSNGNLFHTVTLVIEQDSTGRAITLPAASSTIKYANGSNEVSTTANAVIMITVTAALINSATTYLVTVSPEFV
jgi:hypothetical protein